MKALKCEMCDSTDLVKDGDYFVCQNCGTKYTVEAAKKMMVEGSVKIDNNDKIQNLYKLARQAKDENNSAIAARYYNELVIERPDDWEAQFYSTYYTAYECKLAEISNVCSSLNARANSVLDMISKMDISDDEKKEKYTEIAQKCKSIATMFYRSADSHRAGLSSLTAELTPGEWMDSSMIMLVCIGDTIFSTFSDRDLALELCYYALNTAKLHKMLMASSWRLANDTIIKIDPSLAVESNTKQQSGCYVATCVYGSYDCPEVWTLRRFRDYDLAETWYGRVFVRTYYAISPTIVRWFGDTDWFKNMWRGTLDRMVTNLQNKGYESTPYEDKEW